MLYNDLCKKFRDDQSNKNVFDLMKHTLHQNAGKIIDSDKKAYEVRMKVSQENGAYRQAQKLDAEQQSDSEEISYINEWNELKQFRRQVKEQEALALTMRAALEKRQQAFRLRSAPDQ